MRILGTCVAFLIAFAVTAVVAFVVMLVLAGPHSGLLPSSLETATLVLGWLAVGIVPILAGRWAWRRLAPPRS